METGGLTPVSEQSYDDGTSKVLLKLSECPVGSRAEKAARLPRANFFGRPSCGATGLSPPSRWRRQRQSWPPRAAAAAVRAQGATPQPARSLLPGGTTRRWARSSQSGRMSPRPSTPRIRTSRSATSTSRTSSSRPRSRSRCRAVTRRASTSSGVAGRKPPRSSPGSCLTSPRPSPAGSASSAPRRRAGRSTASSTGFPSTCTWSGSGTAPTCSPRRASPRRQRPSRTWKRTSRS